MTGEATRRVSEGVRLSTFCESVIHLRSPSQHNPGGGDSGMASSLRSALAHASGDWGGNEAKLLIRIDTRPGNEKRLGLKWNGQTFENSIGAFT